MLEQLLDEIGQLSWSRSAVTPIVHSMCVRYSAEHSPCRVHNLSTMGTSKEVCMKEGMYVSRKKV